MRNLVFITFLNLRHKNKIFDVFLTTKSIANVDAFHKNSDFKSLKIITFMYFRYYLVDI